MGKLQQAFPEIKEEKFKAVMFDLMMGIESGQVEDAEIVAPRSRAVDIEPIGEEGPLTPPTRSLVGEEVGWGDVGKGAKPTTEPGFEFEADTNQSPPEPPRPPKKAGRLSREEKEAKRREADEFTGLSDLEIARRLTAQTESKQKKQNGQFTQLGGEGPPGDDEFVVG